MTNEQRESNKLIAEFMTDIPAVNEKYAFKQFPNYFEATIVPDCGLCWVSVMHLSYHLSWDWLMPVVEKIESLGFSTHIIHTKSVGSLMHIINYITDVITTKGENKLEVVYENVVKFIKWYNENIGISS